MDIVADSLWRDKYYSDNVYRVEKVNDISVFLTDLNTGILCRPVCKRYFLARYEQTTVDDEITESGAFSDG